MTTHLPECWTTDPSDPPAWCICDELRACEERMLAKCIAAVEACGDDKGYVYSDNETGIEWAVAALRSLQDQP